jgi:uncharacterized protein (TIGR03435 family)
MLAVVLYSLVFAQSFEVATIKPAADEPGRFFKMQGAHQFYAKGHTVRSLIGAAYNLNPRQISGGPEWAESERFDILAATPGDTRPNFDQQMAMLRKLLTERFKLTFHHEQKDLPHYALSVAKGGPKLKESESPADALPELTNVVFPDHLRLPAKSATIPQFVAMMQRAVMDRPVVDKTGLTGRYDFVLEWAADETQFGGQVPHPSDSSYASLFRALQDQLGLRMDPGKGPVEIMVIDKVERPGEN